MIENICTNCKYGQPEGWFQGGCYYCGSMVEIISPPSESIPQTVRSIDIPDIIQPILAPDPDDEDSEYGTIPRPKFAEYDDSDIIY